MLLNHQILFFGGKGGVGKTTLAAAFALVAAEDGHRTLLVSTDPAHSTGDILEADLGPEPRRVEGELWAMEIDPAREADQYIADVKDRIRETTPPRLVAEVERQIDIARVTPGAEEAALFERFTRIMDEAGREYERVFFDTAPLGPTLRLLSLPQLMTAWMSGLIGRRKKVNVLGRMWRNVAGAAAGDEIHADDPVLAMLEDRKQRFQRAREIVTDARRTAFIFVVIPEQLPIMETQKAVQALDAYDIPVGAIIVNRVLPTDAEGAFLARRRKQEAIYLGQIAETFSEYAVYHVPLFDMDVRGRAALRRVMEELPAAERTPG